MLLTEVEYAQVAKISVKTVRRLINAGRLLVEDYGTATRHNYRIDSEARPIPATTQDASPAAHLPRRRRRSSPASSSSIEL